MTVAPPLFRKVMGSFATGVTVVTTADASGAPYGVTVNSFTSVSLEPPLILVCLDNRLSGLDSFLGEGSRFAVNILGQDQREISNHFATRGSDRSSGVDAVSPAGLPVISGALAHLECRLTQTHAGGDHTVLLGEVEGARLSAGSNLREPLLFYRGRYRSLAADHEESD